MCPATSFTVSRPDALPPYSFPSEKSTVRSSFQPFPPSTSHSNSPPVPLAVPTGAKSEACQFATGHLKESLTPWLETLNHREYTDTTWSDHNP